MCVNKPIEQMEYRSQIKCKFNHVCLDNDPSLLDINRMNMLPTIITIIVILKCPDIFVYGNFQKWTLITVFQLSGNRLRFQKLIINK